MVSSQGEDDDELGASGGRDEALPAGRRRRGGMRGRGGGLERGSCPLVLARVPWPWPEQGAWEEEVHGAFARRRRTAERQGIDLPARGGRGHGKEAGKKTRARGSRAGRRSSRSWWRGLVERESWGSRERSACGEEMGSGSLVRCVWVAAQGERGTGRWDRAMLVSGGASRETREMGIGPGRGLG